jgi:hypothetical protein
MRAAVEVAEVAAQDLEVGDRYVTLSGRAFPIWCIDRWVSGSGQEKVSFRYGRVNPGAFTCTCDSDHKIDIVARAS